LKTKLSKIRV